MDNHEDSEETRDHVAKPPWFHTNRKHAETFFDAIRHRS